MNVFCLLILLTRQQILYLILFSGELPQAIDQPAPKLLEPVTPPCSTELNVDKGI